MIQSIIYGWQDWMDVLEVERFKGVEMVRRWENP
jgi:hypothetical protein